MNNHLPTNQNQESWIRIEQRWFITSWSDRYMLAYACSNAPTPNPIITWSITLTKFTLYYLMIRHPCITKTLIRLVSSSLSVGLETETDGETGNELKLFSSRLRSPSDKCCPLGPVSSSLYSLWRHCCICSPSDGQEGGSEKNR